MNDYLKIDNVFKLVMICVMIATILFSIVEPYSYMEGDSYMLPIESIQHRGSIIITQEDIDNARLDMPEVYSDVFTYNDLRASKLCQIDENNWLAWYFPLYAAVCLPAKLILQWGNFDQIYAFTFTNGLLCMLSFYLLYSYAKKKDKKIYLLFILMIASPIWVYLHYIGAEPLMFAVLVIAMILWRESRYRFSAFLISITCMMNPAIMGFGIVLFMDYTIHAFYVNNRIEINRTKLMDMFKLCCCYIPSLIPCIINYVYLGTLNPTAGTDNVESIWQRVLAYFLDLNFGLASISVVLVLLFVIACIYSVIKRKRWLFMECFALIFTVVIVSFHTHINCGMINTARYVLWFYPCFAFAVYDFIADIGKRKWYVRGSITAIAVISICLTSVINGKYYSYLDFSNVSKYILNRYPQLYWSVCDSTFNSRANHIDGAYDLSGYAVYCDSDTGEVRKIMYRNTSANKEWLALTVTSAENSKKNDFYSFLQSHEDGRIYYINIDRYEEEQYIIDPLYSKTACDWIISFFNNYGFQLSASEAVQICAKVFRADEDVYKIIYSFVNDEQISDTDYVHCLYTEILGRDEDESENKGYCESLLNGTCNRYSILKIFMTSNEFCERHGVTIQH